MNQLEVLGPSHGRSGFDCGSAPLNHYLQQVARQHAERGISRVFVLVDHMARAPKPILGFFSLAACEAESETMPAALPRKFPRKIPAVRLGRLAVSREFQTAIVGLAGLFVDAKDEAVAKFYAKFGFIVLPDQPLTLFLPVQTLLRTVAAIAG